MAPDRKIYKGQDSDTFGIMIASEPFQWSDLVDMKQRNDFGFGRSIEVAKLYREHIKEVKSSWDSMDSFCKHHFLKFPFKTKQEINTVIKYVPHDAVHEGCGVLLTKNNFPYHVSPEILHMVVWSVRPLSHREYKDEVLRRYSEDEYDIIVFENPLGLKSVKTVFHVQVLVRQKS